MASNIVSIGLLALVSAIAIAFGILVFRGNERAFRMLAGGRDFFALDPDGASFRVTARTSGVAVWLIVVALWCVVARAYASLAEPLATALLVLQIVAIIAIGIIVIVQLKQYANLMRRNNG